MTAPNSSRTQEQTLPQESGPHLARRDVLFLGAGTVLGASVVGGGIGIAEAAGTKAPAASSASSAVAAPVLRRFQSSMVTLPTLTARTFGAGVPSAGFLFASPVTDVSTGVIVDDAGEPVWVDPEGRSVMNLSVQTYRGQPVLTFWAGKSVGGHGQGIVYILDTSYRTVATVQMGNGQFADLHEFQLTDRGSALFISYPVHRADLSSVGGPKSGWAFGGRVQEVDVATGEVLLDWNTVDHIALEETYEEVVSSGAGSGLNAVQAFDPVHLNSVEADGDALLVSARHTHTVYRINRSTGQVLWRMGGRKSDFQIAKAAQFAWQHDARRHGPGVISLFDNHKKTPPGVSAGLVLDVDETAMTVGIHQRYASSGHFGYAEGGLQVLPGGNVLVGWGKDVSATEFTAAGAPVYELGHLGTDSYRVRRYPWTATPSTMPDVAATSGAVGVAVHASWNGATEVASWRIESGPSESSLSTVKTVPRSGFETSTTIPTAAMVRVAALDADGGTMRASRVLEV